MSSIKLSPNASGTGEFTISAPNSNTNRTLTLPDASGTFLTNSGTEAGAFSTLSVNSNNISAVNSLGFRNRLLNPGMVIDQRNAGASVTPSGSGEAYVVDRWLYETSQGSKFSVQRNAGSVTPPTGFTNYLGVTSLSAYTPISSDYMWIGQRIEGFNTADLAWGTASAQTVTLSFWVRSSLTGSFGASLSLGGSRTYPFNYTISAANTWEYKTVTISGDTSGTWPTDNTSSIRVQFNIGTGSNRIGTTSSWSASDFRGGLTGATSVVGTNGATFYITGVQLEAGSVATPFERRDYGRELIMCQRYLPAYRATSGGNEDVGTGMCNSTTTAYFAYDFLVEPRVPPTGITVSSAGHFGAVNNAFSATNMFTGLTFSVASSRRVMLNGTGSSSLVQGNATFVRSQNSGAYILFNGCEL